MDDYGWRNSEFPKSYLMVCKGGGSESFNQKHFFWLPGVDPEKKDRVTFSAVTVRSSKAMTSYVINWWERCCIFWSWWSWRRFMGWLSLILIPNFILLLWSHESTSPSAFVNAATGILKHRHVKSWEIDVFHVVHVFVSLFDGLTQPVPAKLVSCPFGLLRCLRLSWMPCVRCLSSSRLASSSSWLLSTDSRSGGSMVCLMALVRASPKICVPGYGAPVVLPCKKPWRLNILIHLPSHGNRRWWNHSSHPPCRHIHRHRPARATGRSEPPVAEVRDSTPRTWRQFAAMGTKMERGLGGKRRGKQRLTWYGVVEMHPVKV